MGDREVPAPGLREVAAVWWDRDEDPVVRWDRAGRRFVLTVPGGDELLLARVAGTADPVGLATTLAGGLAACDFPPTGDGAAPGRVRATLAAAGRDERLIDPSAS